MSSTEWAQLVAVLIPLVVAITGYIKLHTENKGQQKLIDQNSKHVDTLVQSVLSNGGTNSALPGTDSGGSAGDTSRRAPPNTIR